MCKMYFSCLIFHSGGTGKEKGGSLRETLPPKTSVFLGRVGAQILCSFSVHWNGQCQSFLLY